MEIMKADALMHLIATNEDIAFSLSPLQGFVSITYLTTRARTMNACIFGPSTKTNFSAYCTAYVRLGMEVNGGNCRPIT